jgi:hypothetical protein
VHHTPENPLAVHYAERRREKLSLAAASSCPGGWPRSAFAAVSHFGQVSEEHFSAPRRSSAGRKVPSIRRKRTQYEGKGSGDGGKIREILLSHAFVMADTDYVPDNRPD